VFPSRFFRHSCIFVSAKSGIRTPGDLKGRRIGVPEYQMTAPVWIRGILADEYGVKVEDVEFFSGGEEQPGRVEKLKLDLPPHIRLQPIGPTQTLSRMLADGELDAMITARAPSTFYSEPESVKRLFPDFVDKEHEYLRRTKIFPIMHTVVIRRDIYEANRWIAQSLLKAFEQSKAIALAALHQTHSMASMLPWQVAHVEEARREMGEDWWPYGVEANRHVLETFLRYHNEQGLSRRRYSPHEIFAPESLEGFKV
jgi:4,5-dihydroxyphthalate decarboxylase